MLICKKLVLIGLDDKSGKISSEVVGYFQYGVAGALLMDLAFKGSILFQEKNIEKEEIYVQINESSEIKNDILVQTLSIIKDIEKPRRLEYVIETLSRHYSKFRKLIFNQLVEESILNKKEKRRLKIFKTIHYPLVKVKIKEDLLHNIQAILLGNQEPGDQMCALLSIINGIDMINYLFTDEYRALAKKRIQEITSSDLLCDIIMKIIENIQAALMTLLLTSNSTSFNSPL